MTTYKTSELEGWRLDQAVAKAEGIPVVPTFPPMESVCVCVCDAATNPRPYQPSTDSEQADPIIERESITFAEPEPGYWLAWCGDAKESGETDTEAAMRAYVASKLGDTVELP